MSDLPQGPDGDEMPADADRILRALADQDLDDSLPAPDDERLRAYRESRLTPDENRELESLLARSAAGRRRLLELAGIDRSLPLRRVRRAVLGSVDGRRRLTPYLSAAAVAASIALAVISLLPRQHALPAGLSYDVAARGLAEVRSPGEAPSEVRAYPATRLRILIRPRGDSPAGIGFALFRREDGALRRLRQPEEVALASDRGSAAFTGTAARMLASRTPGEHSLYVVASAERDLPALVKLGPSQDPAAALRAPERLVYPVKVTLLRDDPPAKEGAR